MSNVSKDLKKALQQAFCFNLLKVVTTLKDPKDGTIKFLFELSDKERIETVVMKFDYGYSVCLSSQVGCNMGCKFCASGLLKKHRNLSADEIVLQFLQANEYVFNNFQQRISNLVVMGIGEPFDNYDNVIKALSILNQQHGLQIGSRHMTVSTCGLVPKIIQFAKDLPQVNLAISLHAPTDEIRNKIMPINQAYNLKMLFQALDQYQKITNRRISFEYIMLKGINDSKACLQALIKLLSGRLCYVNLIRYNSVNEHSFTNSDQTALFMETLNKHKITCTVRLERGSKIAAACGQLRAQYETKN